MPINHKNKIIFIHIPKTAGTAVEAALNMHGLLKDIGINPYFNQIKDYNVLFGRGLQHFTAHELVQLLSSMHFKNYSNNVKIKRVIDNLLKLLRIKTKQNIWDTYYKFSIVRNPYDRLVSYFAWLEMNQNKNESLSFKRFNYFLGETLNIDNILNNRHLWPQYKFIYYKGKILVDRLIRYENIQDEFYTMMKDIKLPRINLKEKRMVSKHKEYSYYYDVVSRNKVYKFYRLDFEIFGYSK